MPVVIEAFLSIAVTMVGVPKVLLPLLKDVQGGSLKEVGIVSVDVPVVVDLPPVQSG